MTNTISDFTGATAPAANTIVASLPYPAVWAAAQFASSDDAKEQLTYVCARVLDDGNYVIEAVDGHRAFRYYFPNSEAWNIDTEACRGQNIYLKANKALRKWTNHGHFLDVRFDMTVEVRGGKMARQDMAVPNELLLSFPVTGDTESMRGAWGAKYINWPNFESIWPEEFTYNPGQVFAFNHEYLADISKVFKKIGNDGSVGSNVTRVRMSDAFNPYVFEIDYTCGPESSRHLDAVAEVLLMPVQVHEHWKNSHALKNRTTSN